MEITHKTALVVIPPEEVWSSIQSIRQKYDNKIRRWMPHITLLYPFFSQSEFPQITPSFEEIGKTISPFTIVLREFGYFSQKKKRYVLWLAPEKKEPIVELQTQLSDLSSGLSLELKSNRSFSPHMTMGRFQGEDSFWAGKKECEDGWEAVTFTVDRFFMISRNDPPDDVFRVDQEILLEGK